MSETLLSNALNCALFGGQPEPIDWEKKRLSDEQMAREKMRPILKAQDDYIVNQMRRKP